ncbi:hypothetical protein HPB49_004537 [Dermacentor silvarum]|uniref:Uncharacterized protein n=1 Tax=Dermacentor silvarum TaxID=543639 RepID=A0ACB8CPW6_DERSI|nr:hypothetical protein HPB49_004537 [Dermacentor silvarum]
MSDIEKDSVLFLDAMEICKGVRSGDRFLGKTTHPETDEAANHVLVFMIGGLNTRWKQTLRSLHAPRLGPCFEGAPNRLVSQRQGALQANLDLNDDLGWGGACLFGDSDAFTKAHRICEDCRK